jgi:hypothetical protein
VHTIGTCSGERAIDSRRLAARVRTAWVAFTGTGDPAYDPRQPVVEVFGS